MKAPDEHPMHVTALHEAGHAVVALHLGISVGSVHLWNIDEGESWRFGGKVEIADPTSQLTIGERMDRLAVLAAGEAADRLFRRGHGEFDLGVFTHFDGRDWQYAEDLLAEMRPCPTTERRVRIFSREWRRARSILSSNWNACWAIARALSELAIATAGPVTGPYEVCLDAPTVSDLYARSRRGTRVGYKG